MQIQFKLQVRSCLIRSHQIFSGAASLPAFTRMKRQPMMLLLTCTDPCCTTASSLGTGRRQSFLRGSHVQLQPKVFYHLVPTPQPVWALSTYAHMLAWSCSQGSHPGWNALSCPCHLAITALLQIFTSSHKPPLSSSTLELEAPEFILRLCHLQEARPQANTLLSPCLSHI